MGLLSASCSSIPTRFTGDEDTERKVQAEVLLNAYSRDLERRRLSAGAQGLLISDQGTTFYLTSRDFLMLERR